jgi:hypothetical protein
MGDGFPNDVKQFIQRNIESLAQMELLFLLRSESDKRFDFQEISRRLFFDPTMSAQLLQDLAARGFATHRDQTYQYRVIDSETDDLIAKLADTYNMRRVAVTTEIYSKPISRLRTFLDAFRLRKEP